MSTKPNDGNEFGNKKICKKDVGYVVDRDVGENKFN
jgi:hypothetical protein